MLYKRGYERTSIFRNQKTALEKIAKEKGISVRISTVSKNKKDEPLIAVACAGCGRTQLLRERRVVLCDGYTCGFDGHCAKNPRFVLPAVPDGCVRHIVPNAAGAFSGYNTRFANPEEIEAIARARDVLIRGQAQSQCR